VLGWNITPRRRGAGSAIFLHIARPGYAPTEGCIAVSPRTMAQLLPCLSRRTVIEVIG
jgi:L,D-peptidoglycan transpeptidase YkuD (ErfK/YbiS/YcfS/YnhG family)